MRLAYTIAALVVFWPAWVFAGPREPSAASRVPRLGLEASAEASDRSAPGPEPGSPAPAPERDAQPAGVPAAPPLPPIALESSAAARQLRARVSAYLRTQPLGGVALSLVVADAETGREWVRRSADSTLTPASTLKLVTSAVALDRLGPDHRFVTEVLRDGDVLYIRGDGDPLLLSEDLDSIAQAVAKALDGPIRRLVVDSSAFGGGVLPPGYSAKRTDASYRAATGAVAAAFGAVRVEVRPTREGQPPRVVTIPAGDYVRVVNRAQTVRGRGATIRIRLRPEGPRSVAQISGRIGRLRSNPVWVNRRVEHPPLHSGYALRAALQAAGATVSGAVELGITPPAAKPIHRHRSPPLAKILSFMNKESINFIAEMLLRGLVRPPRGAATWRMGQARVQRWLERQVGLAPGTFEFRNGSGLYAGGRFSARQITRVLLAMSRHRYARAYRSSLAISGTDGTLEKRLAGTRFRGRVHAKTGTLNDVSALSGYVRARSGRRFVFSILMNRTGGATARMRAIQDQIVRLIADLG